jgi:transglutaminase-like putative cysteine protease
MITRSPIAPSQAYQAAATATLGRPEAPGAVVYTPARTVRMHYEFVNRQPGTLDIWLALPPELPMQRKPRIEGLRPEPISLQPDGQGLNRLAFFHLAPGERMRFDLQADLYHATFAPSAPGVAAALNPSERTRFLRSSLLIHVTDETRAEAQRIVGDAVTPLEQARRLYLHLIKHYRYRWPPAARGSEAMRRSRCGDCGEYSFLYAAWCRTLGIPCRVLVGTFAHGRFRAHVWNEVFIEGIGWMPADSSVHQTLLRLPGLADLDWAIQRLGSHFGRLTGDRLAFSVDPDVSLAPAYDNRAAPEQAERVNIGGKDLAWGFESLEGAAPYLQPVYVRFSDTKAPLKAKDYLGRWWFDDPLGYRAGTWLMWGAFALGVLGTMLGTLGVERFALPKAIGYVVANLVFIQRTGLHWWKLGLLALFLHELIILIGQQL